MICLSVLLIPVLVIMSTSHTNSVLDFLLDIRLEIYADIFTCKGFDIFTDIAELDADDLDELGITDDSHRSKIIEYAKEYCSSEVGELREWLHRHGLENYVSQFISNDYVKLQDIARLDVDKTLFDDLEIVLPGHRKRLNRAVTELKKKRRLEERTEMPIAYGYWGKPNQLADAKNLFLCVTATVQSTKTKNSSKFDFMVDTGSDVVTISQEALESLDLELLGTVTSRGVHTSKSKRLYKAKLLIGSEVLEIEVMSESYTSIGNHVFRHFHHYITRDKHIWLKGKGAPIPLPWALPEQSHQHQVTSEPQATTISTLLSEPQATTITEPQATTSSTVLSLLSSQEEPNRQVIKSSPQKPVRAVLNVSPRRKPFDVEISPRKLVPPQHELTPETICQKPVALALSPRTPVPPILGLVPEERPSLGVLPTSTASETSRLPESR